MDTWFENESFWREGYRFMFSDDAFRAASDQVEQIIALTGVSVGHVLDLGCGPGRHAVTLALKGLNVTAVDASPFLLGKAKAHANRFTVLLSTAVSAQVARLLATLVCTPKSF